MAFTVTYAKNGATGGNPPQDAHSYNTGDKVTVLGNTGNLTKSPDTWARWNDAPDGTGTEYGPHGNGTFTMGSSNVTLYAQWYTTDGLTDNGSGPGVTTHFKFHYESCLKTQGVEPARTNALLALVNPQTAVCEDDYNLMSGWFGGGITLDSVIKVPMDVWVANLGGGANSGSDILLKPDKAGTPTLLRYLMVSEITEMFMNAQGQGWFSPDGTDEQSCGEGLSRFLAQQFLVIAGLGVSEPGYAISPSWLNSSLPTTNPASTQLSNLNLTTLTSAIDNTVTSLPVARAESVAYVLPFATTCTVQIDSEQMLVTSTDTGSNTLTATRGYNGTTPAAHNVNTTMFYNYGPRPDYVNLTLEHDNTIGAASGCAMLFLYYLNVQLGFSIDAIVGAAPGKSNAATCLRGVYQNLTGDSSDPFPFFSQLLANAFPPDQVSTVPGPNPDNPWPLGRLSFVGAKSTWGPDEVNDIISKGGTYPDGFNLWLEGFNRNVVGTAKPDIPTIDFGGVTTGQSTQLPNITYESPNNTNIPQRIQFAYDINFADPLGTFPTSGQPPTPAAVHSKITLLGLEFPANDEFFFLAGADPYFTNVEPNPSDPSQLNVPWLSQDLRVFTATPGAPGGQTPVPGGPQFVENSTGVGDFDTKNAYQYLELLLIHLNQTYGDPSPSKVDPFDPNNHVIPQQETQFTADSSVTPWTTTGANTYNNYSFAIARVRLKGSPGSAGAATGVKVFFRLWGTQTADTDWDPTYTYLSQTDTGTPSGNPLYPEAPSDNHTIPFFATTALYSATNFNDPTDPEFKVGGFTNTGANNQTITIKQGDGQWAYFGCYLNVNDPNVSVNKVEVPNAFPGTHHCLVAQIAYAGSPIETTANVVPTPESGSQLAQRNLQVTTSDNPGPPSAHRVPQTFDVKPSGAPPTSGQLAGQPDELVIIWGDTPPGSTARIYWPAVSAAEVIQLASWMYGVHPLTAADAHTIEMTTIDGATYVPIPQGTGPWFAGLFTVDLPHTVLTGQEFDIVVRRIGKRSRQTPQPPPPPPPPVAQVRRASRRTGGTIEVPAPVPTVATGAKARATATVAQKLDYERYIVGSFQVKIPVSTAAAMLPAEETTLAILKARLEAMPTTNRWYPVLLRYIEQISERVNGLGGDASSIPPSLTGYRPGHRRVREDVEEFAGKVCEVAFDCFGDFIGFVLEDCCERRAFESRKRAIREIVLRALQEQLNLTVVVGRARPHRIVGLVVKE